MRRQVGGAARPSPFVTILEHALATPLEVGTNLKGSGLAAAWTYLLPSLRLGRVTVAGNPGRSALDRLARLSDEVLFLARPEADRKALPDDSRRVARPGEPSDLMWLAEGALRTSAERMRVAEAARVTPTIWADEAAAGRLLDELGRPAARFLVRPARGEIGSVVPAGAAMPLAWLVRRGLLPPPSGPGTGGAASRRLQRLVASGIARIGLGERYGWLATSDPAGPEALPRYLRDAAADSGIDLGSMAWALAAPGTYRTQKVLMLAGDPAAAQPALVVKMTRDPSANWRLRQAADGLVALGELGLADPGRAPSILFTAEHGGLLIVAEEALTGVRASASKLLEGAGSDATEWLTRLGERSARPMPAAAVAAALGALIDRFAAIHGDDGELIRLLREQVGAIARHERDIPTVFQHGDPGTWNLLVRDDGRVAFLDWENAEPAGMPLWDLLYFLRSFAMTTVPRRPAERRLAHARRAFLRRSPATEPAIEAVRSYCRRLGIESGLIEPLYHLGWMFQALKEASRLEPAELGRGHWLRFLRAGFEERSSPPLASLFGEGTG